MRAIEPPSVPHEIPAALRRSPVLLAVRAAWRRLAAEHGLQTQGLQVLVGCSGGPDSTALLLALWALRGSLGLQLRVACVDHQLRLESSDEAAAVCAVAQRLGVPAESIAVEVPSGPSRMAQARQVRYQALAAAAQRHGAHVVAVGHTQDDQCETMLMRWLGGSGLRGLVGMAPGRPLSGQGGPLLVRPLLAVRRAQIEEMLVLLPELATLLRPLPFEDPSNSNERYQRARLRRRALPALLAEQPRLVSRMSELSEQLRADAECLDALAQAELLRLRLDESPRPHDLDPGAVIVVLPVREMAGLPRALFSRVLLRAAGGGLAQAHLDSLWQLCQSTRGSRSLSLPGQRRAERRYDRLLLLHDPVAPSQPSPHDTPGDAPGDDAPGDGAITLPGPGEFPIDTHRIRLSWRRRAELPPPSPSCAWFALTPGDLPLTVRRARRGERILVGPPTPAAQLQRPQADRGLLHKKISDVLIDLKVPRAARARLRVLATRDQVLWLLGVRVVTPAPPGPPDSDDPSGRPIGPATGSRSDGPLLLVELLPP